MYVNMNKLVTLINEKDLKKRVKELGKEIEKDYKGEDITFICILKGSIHFFSDIIFHRINSINTI